MNHPVRRVAVIGCGDISSVHLAVIATMPDAELVAVCDTDAGRLETAVVSSGVPGFANHRDLLNQIRPDVVHVTTPHDSHVPIAIDALEAGVNVILEKPLAHTREAGVRLLKRPLPVPSASRYACRIVTTRRYRLRMTFSPLANSARSSAAPARCFGIVMRPTIETDRGVAVGRLPAEDCS